jgi:poly-beta-1,6-N-acetyl-D-glucosamine biosynthesis protein PgaD
MEKPGPRPDSARPLIIERPDLQSPPQRVLSTALTVFFWALWVYLWLPAVALLGWAFGIERFYDEMIRLDGHRAVVKMLGWYGLAIGVLAGSLVAWASYNYRRFSHANRRGASAPVRLDQVAQRARVDPAMLLLWEQARVLTIRHDDDGFVESVEAFGGTPAPDGPTRVPEADLRTTPTH